MGMSRPAHALSLLLLLLALALIAGCGGGGDGGGSEDEDQAVAAAKVAFEHAQESGVDLDRGPCVAENLAGFEDWVVDIAHDPREAVDDDPANQCDRYRTGVADHFVELTPDGDLIRAQ
jgi:hypothetical protein